MTARKFLLLFSVAANLLALGYLGLLFDQRLPLSLQPRHARSETACAAATSTPSCPAPPVCPTPSAVLPAPLADAGARPTGSTSIQRFSVCDHAADPPNAQRLRLTASSAEMVAVHCGDRIQVLGFDPSGPRRVLSIEGPHRDPTLRGQSAPVVAADVNGDGLPDLLVGFAWSDETAGPRGGVLFELVRGRDGGFGAPRLLAPLHVSGLSAGQLDLAPGADIAVVHREDTRLGRQNELVLLHGGPSPLKLTLRKLADGARRVATLDLDLDGQDELIIYGEGQAPELLRLDAQGQVVGSETLPIPHTSELLVIDLNGDGRDDAVFAGPQLLVLLASQGRPGAVQTLAEDFKATQLTATDLNADGKLDLVGAKDGTLYAFMQSGELHFEARPIVTLPTTGFVLRAAIAVPGAKAPSRIALLGSDPEQADRVELALVGTDTDLHDVFWDRTRTPIVDAPLALEIALP